MLISGTSPNIVPLSKALSKSSGSHGWDKSKINIFSFPGGISHIVVYQWGVYNAGNLDFLWSGSGDTVDYLTMHMVGRQKILCVVRFMQLQKLPTVWHKLTSVNFWVIPRVKVHIQRDKRARRYLVIKSRPSFTLLHISYPRKTSFNVGSSQNQPLIES